MTNRVEIDLWGGIFSWYQISIAIHFAAASQKEIQTSDIMYSYIVSQLLTSSSLMTINSPCHSVCVIHFFVGICFSLKGNLVCILFQKLFWPTMRKNCSDLLWKKIALTYFEKKMFYWSRIFFSKIQGWGPESWGPRICKKN